MNVIKQERFLYDEVWTERVDKCFISLLVDARAHGLYKSGEPNTMTIEFCTNFLNMEMQTNFSVIDCLNKLAFLQLRFRVFRWLLCEHEVHHMGDTNEMSAPQRVWNEIIQIEPFAMTYQEYGDPNWIELQTIFRGLYNQTTHNPWETVVSCESSHHMIGNINNVSGSHNGPVDAAIDINQLAQTDSISDNSVNQVASDEYKNIPAGTRCPWLPPPRRCFSFPSTCQGSNNMGGGY